MTDEAQPANISALITEARVRVANLPASRTYSYLLGLATIYQESGDRLVATIYASEDRPRIACRRGCAHCCFIPTMMRPSDLVGRTKNIYRLSILDIVALIENFPGIPSGSSSSVSDRILQTAERARAILEPQPCPFLGSELDCSIYPFRPVSCKFWFSPDAELCRYNRENVFEQRNPYANESNSLRSDLDRPFKYAIARDFPALEFGGYDFIASFAHIAEHAKSGRLGELKQSFELAYPGRRFARLLVR